MMETKKVVPVEPLTAEAREEQLYALVGRKVRMMLSGGVWDLKGSPVSFMQNRKNLIADIDDALAQSQPAKEPAAQQVARGIAIDDTQAELSKAPVDAADPLLTDAELETIDGAGVAWCTERTFARLVAQAKLANRGGGGADATL